MVMSHIFSRIVCFSNGSGLCGRQDALLRISNVQTLLYFVDDDTRDVLSHLIWLGNIVP